MTSKLPRADALRERPPGPRRGTAPALTAQGRQVDQENRHADHSTCCAAHEQAEQELRFANSYSRADAIMNLFMVQHPRRVALLGSEWSGCDTYPKAMKRILLDMPRPALDAMTPEENKFLATLPETIDVWRGCYEHNRKGFSWTIDCETAKRFTTLMRYSHSGLDPLLLQGRVRRNDIIFVKLDRNEFEIVPRPGAVEIVAEEFLRKAA